MNKQLKNKFDYILVYSHIRFSYIFLSSCESNEFLASAWEMITGHISLGNAFLLDVTCGTVRNKHEQRHGSIFLARIHEDPEIYYLLPCV